MTATSQAKMVTVSDTPRDLVAIMPLRDFICLRRAKQIALHTGQRGSGRVGRSAAGRALDDNAITLSVVASVRHEDTEYDQLLMTGVPRLEAREQVRPAVDQVLDLWRADRAVT